MGETTCERCGRPRCSVVPHWLSDARTKECSGGEDCYRIGYDRSQAALAAARRECEEANARCAMLDGHFSDAVRVAQDVRADLAAARLETDALKTATRNLINAAEALREGVIPALYDEDLTKSRMVEHLRKLPNLLNASAKAAAEGCAALAAPAAGEEGKR